MREQGLMRGHRPLVFIDPCCTLLYSKWMDFQGNVQKRTVFTVNFLRKEKILYICKKITKNAFSFFCKKLYGVPQYNTMGPFKAARLYV